MTGIRTRSDRLCSHWGSTGSPIPIRSCPGRRLSREEHLTAGALARALGHEWSIVRGACIPLLTLLVAWVVGATKPQPQLAVWAAVVSLIVFELLAGLRSGSTPREFALEGSVGVTMGLAIFALKSLAH